jgi:hypothetical protein
MPATAPFTTDSVITVRCAASAVTAAVNMPAKITTIAQHARAHDDWKVGSN